MLKKPDHLNLPRIGKIHCHTKSETRFIYKEIFERREYVKHGIEIKPGNIVFDVGANVGLFTLFTNKECKNNVSIYSFEPIPPTFELLNKNASVHGLSERDNIKLFNLGLTCTDGPAEAEFTFYRGMSGNSTMKADEKRMQYNNLDPDDVINLIKNRSSLYKALLSLYPIRFLLKKLLQKKKQSITEGETFICRLSTLSKICQEYTVPSIDLLKIDVEGAELDVLLGIEDQDWPKIKQSVIEVYDVNGRMNTIKKLLHNKGFNKIAAFEPTWSQVMKLDSYVLYARRS